METSLMDNFLSNLSEDKNGNSLTDDTHSPSFDFSFVFTR